jgi:hypothetical protein
MFVWLTAVGSHRVDFDWVSPKDSVGFDCGLKHEWSPTASVAKGTDTLGQCNHVTHCRMRIRLLQRRGCLE